MASSRRRTTGRPTTATPTRVLPSSARHSSTSTAATVVCVMLPRRASSIAQATNGTASVARWKSNMAAEANGAPSATAAVAARGGASRSRASARSGRTLSPRATPWAASSQYGVAAIRYSGTKHEQDR